MPGRCGLVQQLEPVADEHAILAAQRRDVGDRRQRDEVEHAVDDVLIAAHGARERERQLERDADRGEILVASTCSRAAWDSARRTPAAAVRRAGDGR